MDPKDNRKQDHQDSNKNILNALAKDSSQSNTQNDSYGRGKVVKTTNIDFFLNCDNMDLDEITIVND